MFFCCGEKFFAVLGQQRLVRGDDRFAQFERGKNHRFGNARTAHQFGDDVNLRVVDDTLPVGGQYRARNGVGARFVKRLRCDFADADANTDARGQQIAVALQRVKNTAAHRAAANHSEIHLLHKGAQLAAKARSRQFIFERRKIHWFRQQIRLP